MNYFKLLDYYPIIHKQYANMNDIKTITNCSDNEAYMIMDNLIDECKKNKFKFYINKNNISIPMCIFIKHFKLNVERITRYHNSLVEFF